MAVVNIIYRHEIQNKLRIEAEFYKQTYVEAYKLIQDMPHVVLKKICMKITDGTHFTPKYTESGVKFYSAVNVKENIFVHEMSHRFISQNEHNTIHKRCPVEAGDILLRKVGVGPRWSCVVPSGLKQFSIFVSVALLKIQPEFSAGFLSTFINCKYGQLQLLRLNKGVSQPDLHLEDIGELLVPVFEQSICTKIEDMVNNAYKYSELSKLLYTQAQQLLESELGLDTLRFDKTADSTAQCNTVSMSEVIETGRFDAQCFSEEVTNCQNWLLQHTRCEYLGAILSSMVKGQQQVESENGTTLYCSIKNISDREIVDAMCINPPKQPPIALKGDLLLAITGATIGKIGIVSRYDNVAFSGDMLRLRANDTIDPHYLLLFLSHKIGQIQLNRWVTGSTNGHLSHHDVRKVLVPRLPVVHEERLSSLVAASIDHRVRSEQLLAKAKNRVEELIEQGAQA